MKGYILLRAKNKEEAECISSLMPDARATESYVLLRPSRVEDIEKAAGICGVKEVHYAFKYPSIASVSRRIAAESDGKRIRVSLLNGSDAELYKLVDSIISTARSIKIDEISPERSYVILKLGGQYFMINYTLRGGCGRCRKSGTAGVFLNGTRESYVLLERLLTGGRDIVAYVPFAGRSFLAKVLSGLLSIYKRCTNRAVTAVVCPLRNSPVGLERMAGMLQAPVYLAGGELRTGFAMSVPIELLQEGRMDDRFTVRGIEPADFIRCDMDGSSSFILTPDMSVHKILDSLH
ncbi:MAG: hypothetical protein ACP5LW_01475 [Nitrososphaeria archaeon]